MSASISRSTQYWRLAVGRHCRLYAAYLTDDEGKEAEDEKGICALKILLNHGMSNISLFDVSLRSADFHQCHCSYIPLSRVRVLLHTVVNNNTWTNIVIRKVAS